MITNYISYFYKCYQADNKEAGVLNFFSSKYENQLIIKPEEELTNNTYPIQFVSEKFAKNSLQTLQLFKNDKELWYGTLFCLGKRKNFTKKISAVAAPLFLYKAEILEKEADYFIKLDHESLQLNVSFCKTLAYKTNFDVFYEAVDVLIEQQTYIDFSFVSKLKKLIEIHIENLTISDDILLFPKLKNQTAIKKELQAIANLEEFSLVSGSGVFISSKINNNNTLVNELEQLLKTTDYSKGLQAFFSSEMQEAIAAEEVKIPLLLNKAQERVVKNANSYDKSVIFGPPGTGKTYSIIAIAQDYISQGKSVLIVTKTAQALQVISDKLSKTKIGNFAIKVGGSYYRRTLLAKLRKITNGYYYSHKHQEEANKAKIQRDYLYKKLQNIEADFIAKTEKEIERMEKLFSDSFFKRTLARFDVDWVRSFEKEEWKIIDNYFTVLKEFEKTAEASLYKGLVSDIIHYSNKEYQKLIALTAVFETNEKSLKNKQLLNLDAEPLTHFLPIWLVKIDEIALSLPLQKDLFDIAIVDEATQCDIASCLPVFQRAKKVVVAGDTNQLRHISFLSVSQMERFQQQEHITDAIRFNFRKKSLLDFTLEQTAKGEQIVLLDEHYRSLPDIIRFSNVNFYGEALRIMTQTPATANKQAVFLHKTTGVQNENGVNTEEANQIIAFINTILTSELNFTKKQATSIGVLSPFRHQITYLTKLIKEKIDLKDIKKHQIKLGTPYHFQGEERDIMLLSMTVSEHSHFASLNYLNKEDVFNVAITRARYQQHIFYSVATQSLKHDSQLRSYLSYFESKNEDLKTPQLLEDSFSKEVQAYLSALNAQTFIGYTIAGLSIDILLKKGEKHLGIDLVGYPGSFTAAFDIERYKILNRVDLPVLPISYLSWHYNKQHQKDIKAYLKRLVTAM